MENKFEFGAAKPKVDVKDDILFAKLLISKKGILKKEKKQIAIEIGVTVSTLYDWEDGTSFPEQERLTRVAEAYEINLEELQKFFDISRAARQKQKEVAKSLKSYKSKNKSNPDTDVYLFGGSKGGLKKSRLL